MNRYQKNIRSYSELILLPTFEERFKYLELPGEVGHETFGYDRYLNQLFYRSKEWRKIRNEVILRDSGKDYCLDLAHPDYPILGKVIIHHMNPIEVHDMDDYIKLLDPEYLICVSHDTHNAIHYGTDNFLNSKKVIEREPNDTCPWKKGGLNAG